MKKNFSILYLVSAIFLFSFQVFFAQGLTTGSMNGLVGDIEGNPLPGANVIALHVPTGTQYGASTRDNGQFNIPSMRVGGPYTITVSYVGFEKQTQENVMLNLGQKLRIDFTLSSETVEMGQVVVTGEEDDVLNGNRTGAATFINPESITALPSIKRSTRDITRLDPRSDGNYSFGGKNWLYNNISVDGSYFNNPFGLDDPSPGGQTSAEPIPFDAVEQVQVSIAPFDVREGGFTGAGINTVTKSGTNQYKVSLYSFFRNESLIGNKISGEEILVPELMFNQSGITAGGPIIKNKLFIFLGYETVTRQDPGSGAFIADSDNDPTNNPPGVSRVSAETMNQIRQRMVDVYGFDPGPYQGFNHDTKNQKFLLKLDWNINENNNLTFRYNFLDASQQKPPHPFAISFNNTGRGPNQTSMPFQNSGYTMNNELNSFALEFNSRFENSSNKFFVSYNIFRDFRSNTSQPYPTIEIAEGGVTYTTVGHEPFSIHNILDQDVLQVTDNFSYYLDNHVLTAGVSFEYFKFFNSFNLFRYGFMGFNAWEFAYPSLDAFFASTDPSNPYDFDAYATPETIPYKGEFIEVSQLSLYAQDEWLVSNKLSLTYGLRVDIPMYITDPVDNQWSRDLQLLDEDESAETVDQSMMPGATPLFSPRIGFNWDVKGDRSTQLRGGTGIFTGRLPFVWVGNNISNPGYNPNLYPVVNPSLGPPEIPENVDPSHIHETKDNSVLMQSSDLNAMASDFKWPQAWTTDLAWDQQLPGGWLSTLEFVYSKDLNAIYVRNANLSAHTRFLNDGRPYYGDGAVDPDFGGGAYVIDNTNEGYNFSVTAQVRKQFEFGMYTSLSYTFMEAKSVMKSTEIASVLWQGNPTAGYSNKPELGWSEFGLKHRIVGGLTHKFKWNNFTSTTIGVFLEVAQGNSFVGAGGNRYSFTYAGDVNGDGQGGNDLIYIPNSADEINLVDYVDANGNTVTAAEQWTALNSFIDQDSYLSDNRGQIAERFALVNPWYWNMDLRVMQDITLFSHHTFQLSFDILNVGNLLDSGWGVRQVANAAVTTPLGLAGWDGEGEPQFNYSVNLGETFQDDPGQFSRWQMQIGIRYLFN